jgi:formate dehydrogenase maturation protein FdhE
MSAIAASASPRASRTQPETPGCPACGSPKLTRLGMTLTDGTPVDFASCHACEWHGWTQQGTDLPLASVLAKATRARR